MRAQARSDQPICLSSHRQTIARSRAVA